MRMRYGLGDSGYPPSVRQASPEHAAHALVCLANQSPGELTLAAIGPLTNIALATRLEPWSASEIQATGSDGWGHPCQQSVIDWYDLTGRPHNANLVLEIDRERLFELMKLSLA